MKSKNDSIVTLSARDARSLIRDTARRLRSITNIRRGCGEQLVWDVLLSRHGRKQSVNALLALYTSLLEVTPPVEARPRSRKKPRVGLIIVG